MQHLNPPSFPGLARQDEVRRLERELDDLQDRRDDVLFAIETEHAKMLGRVLANVAEYERLFWLTDRSVAKSMEILNALRAQNTPLRTQVWDLQAKIKELKGAD